MEKNGLKKIAIIGAGIYGLMIAKKLLTLNCKIDIFDKSSHIMKGASSVNHRRIHEGFHYPRSQTTVDQIKETLQEFKDEIGEECIEDIPSFYGIEKRSKTSRKTFIKFMNDNNLQYSEIKNTTYMAIDDTNLETVFKVNESTLNLSNLYTSLYRILDDDKLFLHLNNEIYLDDITGKYDYIIISTYTENNKVLRKYPEFHKTYIFELCEKPVFRNKSFTISNMTIVDGPFTSIGQMPGNIGVRDIVLGNVKYGILDCMVGEFPIFNDKYTKLLGNDDLHRFSDSNIDLFMNDIDKYFYGFRENTEYLGSMLTIKAKPLFSEDTDSRETTVRNPVKGLYIVDSGKLSTSMNAANEIFRSLNDD